MTQHNADTVRIYWALLKRKSGYVLARVVYDRFRWWLVVTVDTHEYSAQRTARRNLRIEGYSLMDGYFTEGVPIGGSGIALSWSIEGRDAASA